MTLEVMEQENIEGRIDCEKREARERFKALIDSVNSRYRSPESTIAGNENLIKSFEAHNSEILDSAIELGLKKGLDCDSLAALEIAAILHDMAKGDLPLEELGEIKDFVLVNHHEMATEEIEAILKEKYPEILGFASGDQERISRAEKIIDLVKNAVLCHMGPSPGFMADRLKEVNKELEKRGQLAIIHPKPDNDVSRILLAADMKSLAGPGGVQKILNLRAAYYSKGDEELCAEYGKFQVGLSIPEAALISAFRSAREAVSMIREVCGQEEVEWIQAAFDSARQKTFVYKNGGREIEIGFSDINEKMKKFEDRKRDNHS